MGLFDKFRTKKIRGKIGYLGLEDFWLSLTYDECEALIRYERSGLGADPDSSPIEGDFSNPMATQLNYLHGNLSWAIADHYYALADKIIEYCDKIYESSKPIDKHFYLIAAADCYYKQRDTRQGAFELAEQYHLKDVKLFPQYEKPMLEMFGSIPRIPSFQQLAIMYEKTERYQEAIGICRLALEYGLRDNTKGGFEGRLAKLQKKAMKE